MMSSLNIKEKERCSVDQRKPGKVTSGQYIQATVKVDEMNIRAPNSRVIVSSPVCWVTSGRSSIKPSENMIIMEAFRPILSTIMPDKIIPGTSAE